MIPEHSNVVLTRDVPEHHLFKGDLGVIVHVHDQDAYEVEFMTMSGQTVAVVTLESSSIQEVEHNMMPRVREIAI